MEDLPELPEPGASRRDEDHFTADQMREYARKAVLADRERICAIVMDWPYEITESAHNKELAAAIRSSGGN